MRAATRAAGAADVVAVHAEAHAPGGVEADGAGARRISVVATPYATTQLSSMRHRAVPPL